MVPPRVRPYPDPPRSSSPPSSPASPWAPSPVLAVAGALGTGIPATVSRSLNSAVVPRRIAASVLHISHVILLLVCIGAAHLCRNHTQRKSSEQPSFLLLPLPSPPAPSSPAAVSSSYPSPAHSPLHPFSAPASQAAPPADAVEAAPVHVHSRPKATFPALRANGLPAAALPSTKIPPTGSSAVATDQTTFVCPNPPSRTAAQSDVVHIVSRHAAVAEEVGNQCVLCQRQVDPSLVNTSVRLPW